MLNGETRMVHLMGSLNYAEVLQAVKEKFPAAGPFILKYLDRYVACSLAPVHTRRFVAFKVQQQK